MRLRIVGPAAAFLPRLLVVAVIVLASAGSARAQTAAGGAGFSIVLKSDGSVWTFGQNDSGQIGDNSTTSPRKTPFQVPGLSDIVAVAAGGHHALALRNDGVLYAWGHNQFGQLGLGHTTTPQKTPATVLIAGVVAIAAGQYHSVALTSTGDLYVWGRNDAGQLANGTSGPSSFSSTPLYIMTGGAAVGAGLSHTLFVKTDGSVYGAGENSDYQLGTGSATDSSSPVQMSGISTATAAVGGWKHSVVLLSDGTLKACGQDAQGQVGNGLPAHRHGRHRRRDHPCHAGRRRAD